jgi:hypothetical protein
MTDDHLRNARKRRRINESKAVENIIQKSNINENKHIICSQSNEINFNENDNSETASNVLLINSTSSIQFTFSFIQTQTYEEITRHKIETIIDNNLNENKIETMLESQDEDDYESFQSEHDYVFAL